MREIQIFKCDAMTNLIDSTIARSLVQLQKMIVTECKQMTQIIVDEEGETVFPELKTLVLNRLPKLKSFNCGHGDIQFPSLEKVVVCECPHMDNFSRGSVVTLRLAKIISKLDYSISCPIDCDGGLEQVWEGDLSTSVRMIWEKCNGMHT